MKQVLIKDGEAAVTEVPAPQVGVRNILVRVQHSCISVGTEMAGVKGSVNPLYKRLLEKPARIKKAFDFVRDQGIARGWSLATGELTEAQATGYSAAGEVVEVGTEVVGFKPGDLVACAGAGVANHAELIDVPVNLAARIPAGLPTDLASTVTLGAIALQGVRRCNPTLGETIVVIGLGVIGQITVQLLLANGCRVIGVDVDARRVQYALEGGMPFGIDSGTENVVERVRVLTEGLGADAVIIAASTPSHQVVSEAMNACRKKGRVVLVGDVGLNLNRRDFYAKELDFLISCSYGPGRYDREYEENGQDYPLPYVRWTENRNMEAYLALLSAGRVKLDRLPGQTYELDQAAIGFRALAAPGEKPLFVFLSYSTGKNAFERKTVLRARGSHSGRIRVAVVGAGGFAQGMHLPNLIKLRHLYELRGVVSRTGSNAFNTARRFGAEYASTDFQQVLDDEQVDLVIICTRHHLHAPMALQALRAGKHVLVEKPLCLKREELLEIADFFRGNGRAEVLLTGFNRRFSPAASHARQWLSKRNSPLVVNYRMNAGFIPPEHWVHGEEGGGRNIGEACHIYDLFNFLTGSKVQAVQARSIGSPEGNCLRKDNFIATIAYQDGSICTLTYTALGCKEHPKEQMEVFAGGTVLCLNDFKDLRMVGASRGHWHSETAQKGQLEELKTLAEALQAGGEWPIELSQQIAAMEVGFEVEKQL
jgi:predicted dehydrogenase